MKKKNKIHEFNILGAFLQALCTIIVLVLAIVSIMNHSMFPYFEIFMGIDLMIMAYNNKKIFQKEKLTLYYLIFGIIVLIVGIIGVF